MKKYYSVYYYFKVKDSEMYGGEGTIGYLRTIADFEDKEVSAGNLNVIDEFREKFGEMMMVPVKNVMSISREEYEENRKEG